MKILLDNREYIFENIEQKNNMISLKSSFSFCSISNNYKLEFNEFINILESSLVNYVDATEIDTVSIIEEYFNFFKITTNPIVKRNMAIKITYLIIKDFNKGIIPKIEKLITGFKPPIKDINHIFLKIMLRLVSIKSVIDEGDVFDKEEFTIMDFILDYYIE